MSAGLLMAARSPAPAVVPPVEAAWWRLLVTRQYATNAVAVVLAELALRATAGGANLCTGGTAFASSQYSASYNAAKAFDGSLGTYWNAFNLTMPQFVGYHLAAASSVVEMALSARNVASNDGMPVDFALQYSTNSTTGADGTWTTLWSVDHQAAWAASEVRTFDVTKPYVPPLAPFANQRLPFYGVIGSNYHGELVLPAGLVAPLTADVPYGNPIPSWLTVSFNGSTMSFDGIVPADMTDDLATFQPRVTDSSATPQVVTGQVQIIGAAPSAPSGRLTYNWRIVVGSNDRASPNTTYMAEVEMRAGPSAPNPGVGDTGFAGPLTQAPSNTTLFDGSTVASWSYASLPLAVFYPATSTFTVAEVAITSISSYSPNGSPTKFLVQSSPTYDTNGGGPWRTEWVVETTPDWDAGETRHFARPSMGAMALSGTLPPHVLVGQEYHNMLLVRGDAVWPLTVDISAGALPSWLTMTEANGVIRFDGTAPASALASSFTVRVTDSSATPQVVTSTQTVDVLALRAARGWRIANTVWPTLRSAVLYEMEFRATMGGASRTIGGVPFASVNGADAAKVFDGNGSTNWGVSLLVGDSAPSVGYIMPSPVQINQILLDALVTINSTTLQALSSFDVQSSTDTTDGIDGEWLTEWHQNTVGTQKLYTRPGYVPTPLGITGVLPSLAVGDSYAGFGVEMPLTGDFVPNITVDASVGTLPAWVNFTNLIDSGDSLPVQGIASGATGPQSQSFTLRLTDSSATPQVVTLPLTADVVSAATHLSLTGSLPSGIVGVPYAGTMTLGGAYTPPVTIVVEGKPSWMTVDVSGATVSFGGTPVASGYAGIDFGAFSESYAKDSSTPVPQYAHNSSPQPSVYIYPDSPMTLTGTLPGTANKNQLYSKPLSLNGGFITPVVVSGLPSWLTATLTDVNTLTFTGTPTVAGTYNFTPHVVDNKAPTPQSVDGPPQSITVPGGGP